MKSYSELILLDSFEERLEYLKLLDNNVDSPRHISGQLYKTGMWQFARQQVINRDMGFDLGVFGVYIVGPVMVHHINPINEYDILNMTDKVFNPENLITVSINTHNKIHYKQRPEFKLIERQPGDTILW